MPDLGPGDLANDSDGVRGRSEGGREGGWGRAAVEGKMQGRKEEKEKVR